MTSVRKYLDDKSDKLSEEKFTDVIFGIAQAYIAFLQMCGSPEIMNLVTDEELAFSLYTRTITEKDGEPFLLLDIENDPIINNFKLRPTAPGILGTLS